MSFEDKESVLYELSIDGTDAQLGDVENFGWYGLLVNVTEIVGETIHCIIKEDSQGFKHYDYFDTEALAREAWDKLEDEYTAYLGATMTEDGE